MFNPMKLFVGLDVSSFDIKVCFLNGEGSELKSFTFTNDLPGATKLRDDILNVVQDESVSELKIGLESTSVYSFHPSMFLHNDEYIRALGGQVLVMNPKQIANFKKSYSDMDKTDEIDAFVIADYLRTKGKNRFPDPKYIAKSIQKAVRSSYRLDKVVED